MTETAQGLPWRYRLLSLLAVMVLWELAALALKGTFLLAGPLAVAAYITENDALILRALSATLTSAALGYFWGNLAAIALAVLVAVVPAFDRSVRILSLVVFCLPLVATGPILRVLYGPGIGPQVTLAALSIFYTTLLPLLTGLRATPAVWLDLVASYGGRRWMALSHVRLMASVPYLLAGLQIAAPAAVLGALVGEFTGAERGLGVLTLQAMRSLDTEATWAIASVAAAASIAAYLGVGYLGRWIWFTAPPVLIAPPPRATNGGWLQRLATTCAVVAVVLLVWQGLMALFNLNRFFAKRPGDIWTFLITDPDAQAHRETLLSALYETAATIVPGYCAGLTLGAVLAAACVLLPRAAEVLLPVAVTLRTIPIVSTAPLIVLWLGRDLVSVMSIVALMIFFPTLIACAQGMRLVPETTRDLFASYAAHRWDLFWHARIPAAIPAFFASAKIAVPAAVLAATVAEWLATGTGVGNLMALAASTSDYNMLWSAVVALTGLAVAAHTLVGWIEKRVFARVAPEQLQD